MKPSRALVALSLAAASVAPALADGVALPGDGSWYAFGVDALLAPLATPRVWIDDSGLPLEFTFSIGAGLVGTLTVVDAGFAGDTFSLTNFAALFGTTSSVPVGSYEGSADAGLDYDAALGNASFSRGVFALGPGSYRIGGSLLQSVTLQGEPLDATAGGIRLSVLAPVPEPETYAMLLAGLGVLAAVARRRGGNA